MATKFPLLVTIKQNLIYAIVFSEALSTQNFHWVLGRIQHHLDMLTSDKKNAKLWERRLTIAMQVSSSDIVDKNETTSVALNILLFFFELKTLKELFKNLVVLQTMQGEDAQALFKMLLNNVCYVLEFRESVLHSLTSYNENRNTK